MNTRVVLSVDRTALPPHTDEQFEEWVKFNVCQLGGISMNNPLSDIDMEARVKEISN